MFVFVLLFVKKHILKNARTFSVLSGILINLPSMQSCLCQITKIVKYLYFICCLIYYYVLQFRCFILIITVCTLFMLLDVLLCILLKSIHGVLQPKHIIFIQYNESYCSHFNEQDIIIALNLITYKLKCIMHGIK